MTSSRSLPPVIEAGEYVIHRDGLRLRVADPARPAATDGNHALVWTGSPAVWLTEEQTRHLLSMPGRPHDSRLDGPEIQMVPWWEAVGRRLADGDEVIAVGRRGAGSTPWYTKTSEFGTFYADDDGMVPVLPEGDEG